MWFVPVPHRPIAREFRAAVYASPQTQTALAHLAGFPAHSVLNHLLNDRHVVATPQTIARMTRLAELVGYTGPLFKEEAVSR
jgi:hypothetical protein